MKHWGLVLLGAVTIGFSAQAMACVHVNDIYYWADKRDAEHHVFEEVLNCEELPEETLETALISLGRVGGQAAVAKVIPYLQHENPNIRYAAAFAVGIGKSPSAGSAVVEALKTEKAPEVQYRLALSLGNMAYSGSQFTLTQIINQDDSVQKVRGALHGLMILATFYRDKTSDFDNIDKKRVLERLKSPETQLEASYLLARVPLIDTENTNDFLQMIPTLAPAAKANLLRALAKTKQRQVLPTLLTHLDSEHIGVRVNAIRSLANYPDNPAALAAVMQALSFDDVISQVTALTTIRANWLQNEELLDRAQKKLKHSNSWVQSEALLALNRSEQGNKKMAQLWLQSDDPNHQRAAIDFLIKKNDTSKLENLAKSDKPIIASGAKKALNPETPKPEEPSQTGDALPELPVLVKLETTKGDITIKLFADTPYTSLNFIELVESGFYNNTYFHRVIPNFVVQGGSQHGDGSGNVDYSIREELSYRSHLPGTVGMATIGKDTGGAQFFINTAPNLHLDSNYTIFGEVVDGMGVAIKLEQNDKVVFAEIIKTVEGSD